MGGVTVKTRGACVTVTTTGVKPDTITVILAVRSTDVPFAE